MFNLSKGGSCRLIFKSYMRFRLCAAQSQNLLIMGLWLSFRNTAMMAVTFCISPMEK